MTIENLFFDLLQVAVGTRDNISRVPTTEEWRQLFELSKKQALTAVTFRGLSRLKEFKEGNNEFGNSLCIEEITYLKWLGVTAKVVQKNKRLSATCASLCKELAHDGLYSCILKGQSNLCYYSVELRDFRTPGDIDVWCGLKNSEGINIALGNADVKGALYEKYTGERGVIEWVLADYRVKGKKMPEVNYHHVDWEYKGTACEVHFRPSWMNCPWHNARLQKWCTENEQWNICKYNEFNIPSISFNVVYQLVHIYRHLFNEGIGLRQLLDYYFVLRTLYIKQGELPDITDKEQQIVNAKDICVPSNEDIMRTLKYIGVDSFAGAVMYVLQKVFAMPSEYLICAPDTNQGEFLLNEIMLAGNFGKYDERNAISANEGYLKRFVRRQKRFMRFLTQYPSEVIWGPYFSVKQRLWRMCHGWR